MRETRTYISGPITGLPDNNRAAFHAEAARLRALGHYVVNPAEIELDEGATWSDYMRADIAELVTCTHIRMLRGWEKSEGAVLELTIACKLGFAVSVEGGDVNTYTRQFVAACPNNGEPIIYTLRIEVPAERMIQVEHIVTATALIKQGFHEQIADELFGRFGGRQILRAHHHGVDIETVRGGA